MSRTPAPGAGLNDAWRVEHVVHPVDRLDVHRARRRSVLDRHWPTRTLGGSRVSTADPFMVVCSVVDWWSEAAKRRVGPFVWRVRSG